MTSDRSRRLIIIAQSIQPHGQCTPQLVLKITSPHPVRPPSMHPNNVFPAPSRRPQYHLSFHYAISTVISPHYANRTVLAPIIPNKTTTAHSCHLIMNKRQEPRRAYEYATITSHPGQKTLVFRRITNRLSYS